MEAVHYLKNQRSIRVCECVSVSWSAPAKNSKSETDQMKQYSIICSDMGLFKVAL